MLRNRSLFRHTLMVLTLACVAGAALAQTSLDQELEPYLSKYELPALAAAVVKNGKIIAAGAVGTRRAGANIPVTLDDRFHLGSDTKAMTAHMSVLDFARWAGWNAGEGRRGPRLVSPETMRKLHTPVVEMPTKSDAAPGTPSHGRYGLGWGQLDVEWAPVPLLYHGGSNGKNLAHIWIEPGRDFAMVVVTNISNKRANEAFFALAPELYKKFAGSRK